MASPSKIDVPLPSVVVVSGGTGCNAICPAFGASATYVLPVSDDGGSSSEIIRVLGGPSIGDIRSRLIRLIPDSPDDAPLLAIRRLLSFRIPVGIVDHDARELWRDIVEGRSTLWDGIPLDRKETIRGFLVYFENEVLRRSHKNFSFRNGSVGNFFLVGAQLFFRSLPSAIFLFSSITTSKARILPAILTNHTVTLAATLTNQQQIIGQCQISHPVSRSSPRGVDPRKWDGEHYTHSSITDSNVSFVKVDASVEQEDLEAPISRVFYINAFGQEIFPQPNPDILRALGSERVLVYSCGSLWTSIMPCLALESVGGAIAKSKSLKAKVLLLNGKSDRETAGYTAMDFVRAIVATLSQHLHPDRHSRGERLTTLFITHLVYLRSSQIRVDRTLLEEDGICCIEVGAPGQQLFDVESVNRALHGVAKDLNPT